MSGVERSVSRNHVDQVRARLIAESGVHHAIGALRGYLDSGGSFLGGAKRDLLWVYRGEDLNLNGRLDAGERDLSAPPDLAANGKADTIRVPLRATPNPSFPLDTTPAAPAVTPRRIAVDGTARIGISGAMTAGSYGRNSDVYTLKIIAANSLIYVNDVNPNLPRILDNLCDLLRIPRYGDAIWNGRPYGSLENLERVVANPDHYLALLPFVTTTAWVDDRVVNPVPLSDAEAGAYKVRYVRPTDPATGKTIYRFGHGRNARGEDRNAIPLRFCRNPSDPVDRRRGGIYGWDELNPQWIEMTTRAPIDLNSAPREVLIAVLQDLKGFFAMETPANVPDYGYDFVHRLRFDPDPNPAVAPYACWSGTGPSNHCYDFDKWPRSHVDELASLYETMAVQPPGATGSGPDAGVLADRLLAARPFRSWEEFHAFCDALVGPGLPIWDDRTMWQGYPSRMRQASQAMADVLKANFNPNLHLNELNPNAPLLMLVDKTDLITASAEGTLRPMGVFKIESLGRVLQPAAAGGDAFTSANNTTVAEAEISATIRLFDVHHDTSQKDFFAGKFEAASGRRTDYGLAVESGPEPHNGPAAGENEFEGYVSLATLGGDAAPVPNDGVLRTTDLMGGAADSDGALMHAHYAYDFDLHYGASGNCRVLTSDAPDKLLPGLVPPGIRYNYPDPAPSGGAYTSPYCPAYDPARHRLARSFRMPPARPGVTATPPVKFRYAPSDLRVDGAYSERHSALVYSPQGPEWREGRVSYWIKPGYSVTNAGKPRVYFNMNRMHKTDPLASIQNNPLIPANPDGDRFKQAIAKERERFNPTPFLHAFLPHQVYDLARGIPYAKDMFDTQENLFFEYANMLVWWPTTGGQWQEWDGSVRDRVGKAVYNAAARDFVLNDGGGHESMIGFKPRSFAFGLAHTWPVSGIHPGVNPGWASADPPFFDPHVTQYGGVSGQEYSVNTSCLNHAGHPHGYPQSRENDGFDAQKGDLFEQGRWTHVTLAWNIANDPAETGWNTRDHFRRTVQIRVNGKVVQTSWDDVSFWDPLVYRDAYPTRGRDHHITWQYNKEPGAPDDPGPPGWPNHLRWLFDEYGYVNPIRIGTPSVLHPDHSAYDDRKRYESNYPADATIDELYVWMSSNDLTDNGSALTQFARSRFLRGRYYNGRTPRYTSREIDLAASANRRRPAPGAGSTAAAGTAAPAPPRPFRLYGIHWTAYNDKILDYASDPPSGPLTVQTQFGVRLTPGGPFTGTYTDEQYSFVGQDIVDPARFQYRFEFAGTAGRTLLESPVVDDVWIVYGTDRTEILEWVVK